MQNGTIIVLAWPEGMVKNADSWYDFFLSKNGMYRVCLLYTSDAADE